MNRKFYLRILAAFWATAVFSFAGGAFLFWMFNSPGSATGRDSVHYLIPALMTVLLLVLLVVLFKWCAKSFSRPLQELDGISQQMRLQSAAIQSAANGIVISDADGIVEWVNPAFSSLTGYSWDEIVGKSLNMLNSGAQSGEFFQAMWEKIKAGEVWHDEVVNRRKDGSLYTEEMTITPVLGEDGGILRFVAVKSDITERKRLEMIVKKENERMEGELNVARDIQASMVPMRFPAFPDRQDIDVYARLIPAREVGGDFYDFFFTDEENFCFVIGDVSGKGVPAALFMAVTKAIIKAAARSEYSTARVLRQVNNEISRDNDNNMFITVFIGMLNTTTGYLTYTNAGHNPPFVIKNDDGSLLRLGDLHGAVIGAFEGVEYRETVIRLQRGDAIVAYTDGVTEAMNPEGHLFTEQRLMELLGRSGFIGCNPLVTSVTDEIIHYEAGAEQADDITCMAVSFCEPTESSIIDYLFTTIPNRLEHITSLVDEFGRFAGKHEFPVEVVQKVDIVFDELLSNIISYAYPDNREHEIEIRIRFYEKMLIVTIMDDGNPFNPFDRDRPDTGLGLEDRESGGLGVHLVKLLVDEYHHEYKPQIRKNITSFKKHI